jgi:hypothetical protein
MEVFISLPSNLAELKCGGVLVHIIVWWLLLDKIHMRAIFLNNERVLEHGDWFISCNL